MKRVNVISNNQDMNKIALSIKDIAINYPDLRIGVSSDCSHYFIVRDCNSNEYNLLGISFNKLT